MATQIVHSVIYAYFEDDDEFARILMVGGRTAAVYNNIEKRVYVPRDVMRTRNTKLRIETTLTGDYNVYIDEPGHVDHNALLYVMHASNAIDKDEYTDEELEIMTTSSNHERLKTDETVFYTVKVHDKTVLLYYFDKQTQVYHLY